MLLRANSRKFWVALRTPQILAGKLPTYSHSVLMCFICISQQRQFTCTKLNYWFLQSRHRMVTELYELHLEI